MKPTPIRATDVFEEMHMEINVKIKGLWRVRLGVWIMRLGAMVAGLKCDVTEKESP
jgi:hypothetical protein